MKKLLVPLIIILLTLGWMNVITGSTGKTKNYNKYMANAKALDEKGIYIDAVDQYEKALEYTNNKLPVGLLILDDYLALKKNKDFEKKAKELIDTYDYPDEVVLKLTNYYVDRKQVQNAMKLLSESLKKNPDNAEFVDMLAQLKGTYSEVFLSKESVEGYYNKSYIFINKGKQGLVKSDGKDLRKAEYDRIYPYGKKPYYASVLQNNEWFYVDKDGYRKLVPDFDVEFLGVFGDNIAPYSNKGIYSYINDKMEKASEETWDFAGGFADKRAAVKRGDKWAIIKNDFSAVTEYIYDAVIVDEFGFCSSYGVYIAKLEGYYRVFDLDGNQVGSAMFDDAKAFVSDEPAAVKSDGKWGFVSKEGELLLPTEYDEVKSFSNGYAPVCSKQKWGYIDLEGKLRIELNFEEADNFFEGVAAVKMNSWKLIKLIE